ncbi:hypothetical protein QMK19_24745 [Streptomyces sp. H10-C2]|uniref:hypothetical protein n=1 Tax=unclassified Streptomyces TaxID=2593676 RepID=UPI0024BB56A0|nr:MULTISPECIES: hypothetical protein [unclassified Streptomyces]MDJ0343036.1 hypothetical protein [Streptomyces sp. PH10-H1]MDJ0372784.1 hypothetical protein [Streptomyces sp. H10-C2]
MSSDSRTLAASASNSTIWLWNTDTDQVAAYICTVIASKITREEWKKYVPDLPYNPPC